MSDKSNPEPDVDLDGLDLHSDDGSEEGPAVLSPNDGKELKSSVAKAPFAFPTNVPPLSESKTANCWSEPDGNTFRIRGPTYDKDKVKVSNSCAYRLLGCDMYHCEPRAMHIASRPDNPVQILRQECEKKNEPVPFVFVVNICMPWGNYVGYWTSGTASPYIGTPPVDKLLSDFLNGDDTYRNSRFKFIGRMIEGNYLIKKSIGDKPAIIGKKIQQQYFRGKNYFEVDVDLCSSSVAKTILKLVSSYITSVVMDLAFVIEGITREELPEQLLGVMRFHKLDIKTPPKITPAPSDVPTDNTFQYPALAPAKKA